MITFFLHGGCNLWVRSAVYDKQIGYVTKYTHPNSSGYNKYQITKKDGKVYYKINKAEEVGFD